MTSSSSVASVPGWTSSVDGLAEWALAGPLALALALLCAAQLATWLPHYLTWPLWCDTDWIMNLAHRCEVGRIPYRDWHNFPGPLYQYWLLGKVAGWGNTVAVQAADAALMLLEGGLLLAWSRRRFGRLLPGLCGAAALLSLYLSLDYTQVGQRDWVATEWAVAGLLIAQGWPGRAGRWISAGAVALGVAYRPPVVLLLPAMAAALDEVARPPGGSWSVTVRAWLGWTLAFAFAVALAFSPLLWAGILDDFLRNLREVMAGGNYYRLTPGGFLRKLASGLSPLGLWAMLATAALFSGRVPAAVRRLVLTWVVAWACVLLYNPIAPANHDYLHLPERLVGAVALAALVGLVLEGRDLSPAVKLAMVLLLLALNVTTKPRFCKGTSAIPGAIRALRRGEDPESVPPGYTRHDGLGRSAVYQWDDYRATLAYLRRTTSPSTEVVNALLGFPSLNGPTGRLSPYPNDSTLAWVSYIRPGYIGEYARAVERTPDSVVAWAPVEPFDKASKFVIELGPLEEVIRRLYEREARFGTIEVWRRKSGANANGERRDELAPGNQKGDVPVDRTGQAEGILKPEREHSRPH